MTETTPNPELDPDENEPENEPEAWTPPTKEEHEKMKAALAARKKERDEAKRELAQLRDKDKNSTQPTPDPDVKTKRQGVIAALVEAGLTRDQAKAAVPLIDLSSVEIDEDGDVEAVEHVTRLRTTFPGLFPTKRTPPVNTQGGRSTNTPTGDKVTDQLLRSAGYR